MAQVTVRFAPSPTGFLHVGGLRTALFNFLYAKKTGGKFILRIEDTDKGREVPGAVENIIDTLKNFRLPFDEGPVFQSQRLPIYRDHVKELLDKDAAYKCYCTEGRIAELKLGAETLKQPFRYDKHCLRQPQPGGDKFVIRQNIPEEGSTEFDDLVHGKIRIENRLLDDGVLIKSDGWPVYNFANVIDDHLMEISHVIRGEEFIPSTPKHILLYRAFGWNSPQFAHLPLILDTNRKKLSKRTGDVAVRKYVDKGYAKEALLNFVALLGWNPKTTKEIFSLEELIQEFAVEKINRAGAIFDLQKLDFINRQWQKRLGNKDPLIEQAKNDLLKESQLQPAESEKLFKKVWPQIMDRVKPSTYERGIQEFRFYFVPPEYDAALLLWKESAPQTVKTNLEKLKKFLLGLPLPDFEKGVMETKTKDFLKKRGITTGEALWPLRVALSGLKASPGPFEILESFAELPEGKKIIEERLETAIAKLANL